MLRITHVTLTLTLMMVMQGKLVVIDLDNREDMRELTSLIGKGRLDLGREWVEMGREWVCFQVGLAE